MKTFSLSYATFTLDQPVVQAGVVPTATLFFSDPVASLAMGIFEARFEGGRVIINIELTDTSHNPVPAQTTIPLVALPPGTYSVDLEECMSAPNPENPSQTLRSCFLIESETLQVLGGTAHPVPALDDISACLALAIGLVVVALRQASSK